MGLKLSGLIICRIKIGATNLDFRSHKNHLYPVLNGSQLYEPRTTADFTSDVLPIVGLITANLAKKTGATSQILYEEASPYAGMLSQWIQDLEKSKGFKVEVLTVVPDEIQNNTPNDFQKLAKKATSLLSEYRDTLQAASKNVLDCVDLAEALLNTNLPKTMWGVQGVQKVLTRMSNDMEQLAPVLEQFEIASEKSDLRLGQLHKALGSNITGPAVRDAMAALMNDFMKIKGLLAQLVQILYQLCDIDKVFKKQTGYPATWFFNSSTFYDFIYCFENVLNDLIKMTAVESGMMDPLSALLNKDTGEKTCPTI